MQSRDINFHITSGSIIKTILFLLLVAVLWFLRDIVLIVLTAVVIASAMEPGIHALVRRGVPRLPAVIMLYVSIGVAFFCALFFFVPPILNDAANFLQQLPVALANLN